eukprot:CAMPEP_0117653166 /NCGR_PEP_ID=MMETSP0804-20121206/3041_1 /TAXON_ID=1074897 /ORGANISM="Tetraselmis astigmatica, Strain CCMP880" /LENGTH=78 /DNA_ID=CAMNT_0005459313 /DNA_START=1612 /DNA_END=1848 /DNA_ORIENTATION=-
MTLERREDSRLLPQAEGHGSELSQSACCACLPTTGALKLAAMRFPLRYRHGATIAPWNGVEPLFAQQKVRAMSHCVTH